MSVDLVLAAASASSGGFNWTEAGAIAGLFTVVIVVAGIVGDRVNKWRKHHVTEQSTDQRVLTTLFGKEAQAPYPKIEGLVAAHQTLSEMVIGINKRVTALELIMNQLNIQVDKLVERTEENGGGSIKDQLNFLVEYIKNEQTKNGES